MRRLSTAILTLTAAIFSVSSIETHACTNVIVTHMRLTLTSSTGSSILPLPEHGTAETSGRYTSGIQENISETSRRQDARIREWAT